MNLGFLARRIAGALFTLLLATIVAASLVQIIPGDAADYVAGDGASEEQVAKLREQLGTSRPLVEQYATWVGGALRFDFGTSIVTDREVSSSITRALPVTGTIVLLAALGALVIGVGLGTAAGVSPGSWIDRMVSTIAAIAQAVPPFWLGLTLVTLFALERAWFPATGYVPPSEGIGDWLKHAALPAATLAFAMSAELTRQTRAAVIDVMRQPYITSARVKGMPGWWMVRKHVLRNAAIPVITVLGLQVGRMLGGAVVIEVVFGLPGLGSLAIDSVLRRDFPVLQAYVFTAALIVVTISLLVDLSYGVLNPKVRARA